MKEIPFDEYMKTITDNPIEFVYIVEERFDKELYFGPIGKAPAYLSLPGQYYVVGESVHYGSNVIIVRENNKKQAPIVKIRRFVIRQDEQDVYVASVNGIRKIAETFPYSESITAGSAITLLVTKQLVDEINEVYNRIILNNNEENNV